MLSNASVRACTNLCTFLLFQMMSVWPLYFLLCCRKHCRFVVACAFYYKLSVSDHVEYVHLCTLAQSTAAVKHNAPMLCSPGVVVVRSRILITREKITIRCVCFNLAQSIGSCLKLHQTRYMQKQQLIELCSISLIHPIEDDLVLVHRRICSIKIVPEQKIASHRKMHTIESEY